MTAPDWVGLAADGAACLRCGVAWRRDVAADPFYLADDLAAFARYHAACPEPGPDDPAAVAADPPPAAAAAGAAVPVAARAALRATASAACPGCGTAYPGRRRRCYTCRPPRRREPPGGDCPGCGRPYGKVRRCFACRPTPVMLRRAGAAADPEPPTEDTHAEAG